ncbi:MAG: hypothetical protein R3Y23_02610 [Bacillota bacterium]
MKIVNDVFDIARRVREVDRSYNIKFCNRTNKFKLYGDPRNSYILTLPYDRLDARTVEFVRKTRVERLDAIIEEIEENNRKLEASAMKEALNATEEQLTLSAEKVFYERDH